MLLQGSNAFQSCLTQSNLSYLKYYNHWWQIRVYYVLSQAKISQKQEMHMKRDQVIHVTICDFLLYLKGSPSVPHACWTFHPPQSRLGNLFCILAGKPQYCQSSWAPKHKWSHKAREKFAHHQANTLHMKAIL